MTILLNPVCLNATSDAGGLASFSVKVPGTFGLSAKGEVAGNPLNGYVEPYADGRFFVRSEIWSKDAVDGDMIINLVAIDNDGVMTASLRSIFPLYPIISTFYDSQITETDYIKKGVYAHPSEKTLFTPPLNVPVFIPSGIYLQGTYKTSAANRVMRANIFWGSYLAARPSTYSYILLEDEDFILQEDGYRLIKERL